VGVILGALSREGRLDYTKGTFGVDIANALQLQQAGLRDMISMDVGKSPTEKLSF
jgi:hypothetical protein